MFGWGIAPPEEDPFVGFAAIHPLFEMNATGTEYQISPKRYRFFARDQFPVVKGERTRRIFCLGGSTVQGRPYSIQTSFTTWMRIGLEERNPETQWEVVNCGGISYASYRLVPILEEVLQYEPDLIIICTGHNEFLEDRTYAATRDLPTWSYGSLDWLLRRRLVVIGSQWLRQQQSPQNERGDSRPVLRDEVDAMLDYRNGIAAYSRDDHWHTGVADHFESNLQRMVERCQAAGVPLLLLQPPSNLSGQPPFKSEHTPGLSEDEIVTCSAQCHEANALAGTNLTQAITVYREAVEQNPRHAQMLFELGRLEQLARYPEARSRLVSARDEDICPLRMTSSLEVAMQRVAAANQVPFVNLHAFLEHKTDSGILGDEWLVDHVHPSFSGHQEIAIYLIDEFAEQGWIGHPGPDWETRARERFKTHFASLDKTYFHRGQRMLQSLRGWTRGDKDGKPVEERFPNRVPSPVDAQ